MERRTPKEIDKDEMGDTSEAHCMHRAMIAVVVAFIVLWGCTIMTHPLLPDQTLILVVAKLIKEGRVMYRDVWNQNMPGNFLLYLFSIELFGDTPRSVYWLDIVWRVATLFPFYFLVKEFQGRRTALIAVATFGAASTIYWSNDKTIAQKDVFMLLFLVLAMYVFVKYRTRMSFLKGLGVGALIGLGTLMKPTALTVYGYLGLVLAIDWATKKDRSFGKTLESGLGMSVGIVVPWMPILIYEFLAGGLEDMWGHTILFNAVFGRFPEELSAKALLSIFEKVFYIFQIMYAPAYMLTLIGILCLINDRKIKAYGILLGWIPFLLVGIIAQRKFFPHHWVVLLAPAIPLMAYGVDCLLGALVRADRTSVRPMAIGLIGLAGIVLFQPPMLPYAAGILLFSTAYFITRRTWPDRLKPTQEQAAVVFVSVLLILTTWARVSNSYEESWRGLRAAIGRPPETRSYFPDSVETCDYIISRVPPDDKILVWSWNATLYYLSGRRPPTAYLYDLPLTFSQPKRVEPAYFTAYKQRNRKKFLKDITANPPVLVIVGVGDNSILEPYDSKKQLDFVPEFKAFLATHYRLDRIIDSQEMYLLDTRPES